MKKLLFLLLIIVSMPSYSQNNSIWLEKGKGDLLAVGEFKDIPNENVFNYLYAELGISKHNDTRSAYILLSRDQKWWDKHLWIHGELRSFVGKDFSTDNIYLIGPMFELTSGKIGFINLQTMYRQDKKANYQITVLSDAEYGRMFYSMYADVYGSDRVYLHSENRLFFKIIPHIRVGANILISSGEGNGDFYVKPMAVIRVDL